LTTDATPAHKLHGSVLLLTAGQGSAHVSVQDLSRPLYKKDIFYSGSVYNVSHMKSQHSDMGYIASMTNIPQEAVSEHNP